ncbi:MAG: hypothetical protein ACKVPX_10400 [Myxococcaceae bacterium]
MKDNARAQLERAALERASALSTDERERWNALRERVRSAFQSTCLDEAWVAGHALDTLESFAESMKGLTDAALAAAIQSPAGEALDPLAAFERNGHVIRPSAHSPDALLAPSLPPRKTVGVRVSATKTAAHQAALRDLGQSDVKPTVARGVADDLFSDAGRAFGVRFREFPVDTGDVRLEAALEKMAAALAHGFPIPVVLGARAGDFARYALVVQMFGEGKRQAFQLHDPFANETVWVNARDVLARKDLPFEDTSLRRVTRVALPERFR